MVTPTTDQSSLVSPFVHAVKTVWDYLSVEEDKRDELDQWIEWGGEYQSCVHYEQCYGDGAPSSNSYILKDAQYLFQASEEKGVLGIMRLNHSNLKGGRVVHITQITALKENGTGYFIEGHVVEEDMVHLVKVWIPY